MDKIVNDWRQASVESTQMLKQMVDERRSRRIQAQGELRLLVQNQEQQFCTRVQQWQMASEQAVANATIDAKQQDKLFEGATHQGFQGSEQIIRNLDETVRSEITVRNKKYNDIISTLGRCTQIMQG